MPYNNNNNPISKLLNVNNNNNNANNQRSEIRTKPVQKITPYLKPTLLKQEGKIIKVSSPIITSLEKNQAPSAIRLMSKDTKAGQIKGQEGKASSTLTSKSDAGIEAFTGILLHASKCKSCPQLSCRKMRIVLEHYIQCGRLASGASCIVCKQLLDIVTKHAKQFCKVPKGQPCPLPLCDQLKCSTVLNVSSTKTEIQSLIIKEEPMELDITTSA